MMKYKHYSSIHFLVLDKRGTRAQYSIHSNRAAIEAMKVVLEEIGGESGETTLG